MRGQRKEIVMVGLLSPHLHAEGPHPSRRSLIRLSSMRGHQHMAQFFDQDDLASVGVCEDDRGGGTAVDVPGMG